MGGGEGLGWGIIFRIRVGCFGEVGGYVFCVGFCSIICCSRLGIWSLVVGLEELMFVFCSYFIWLGFMSLKVVYSGGSWYVLS